MQDERQGQGTAGIQEQAVGVSRNRIIGGWDGELKGRSTRAEDVLG